MLSAEAMSLPAAALDEAKAYLRIFGSDEDALTARLLLSAATLCESFTGQACLVRSFTQTTAASGTWGRLNIGPVRAIGAVEALAADGIATALQPEDYAIDIDAAGDGWVRVTDAGGAKLVRVHFEAGVADEWSMLPEPLRQGIVRLAAHLFVHRDAAAGGEPPAAVTALWRPWRRMRLA